MIMVRVYHFRCKNPDCKLVFEKEIDYDKIKKACVRCPKCRDAAEKVIVFAPPVRYIGTGFYINDKNKKG